MAIVKRRLDPIDAPRLSADEHRRLDAMSPEMIETIAEADPDNPPTTDDQLARAVFARDVRLAREKAGLTQPLFAGRFRISLSRLRDWERGRYRPDTVAAAYIKAILHDPKAIERALAADDR